VKMKSFPQSTHLSTLSWNSMTRLLAAVLPGRQLPPSSKIKPTYLGPATEAAHCNYN
jgi:hypothetical protein